MRTTSGGRLAEGRQRGDGGGGGRPAKSESTLGRSQRLGYNHDRRPRTAMVVAKEPSNPYRRSSRGGEGSRLSRSTTRAPRVRPAPWCGVALAFRAGAIRTTRTNDKYTHTDQSSAINGGEQTQLGWQSAERRGEERRGEESTTTLHLAATTRSKVGSVGRHSIAPARTREAPLNVSECRCEGCAVDTRSHPRELARLAHGRDHRRRPSATKHP